MTVTGVSQIKALIFDFDGLILDTETPDVHAWENIYAEYGFPFPLDLWAQIIGGTGGARFDAAAHLQSLTGNPLDLSALQQRQTQISHSLVERQAILPGVVDTLREARRLGLKLAIASSSPHSWVDTHASRLGVLHFFDHVICGDDVGAGRTKPNPDLYLLALERLRVRRTEAIVFEDSPNGVRAARSAGLFVVAVPNEVTTLLALDQANLVLKSLTDLSLRELLKQVQ